VAPPADVIFHRHWLIVTPALHALESWSATQFARSLPARKIDGESVFWLRIDAGEPSSDKSVAHHAPGGACPPWHEHQCRRNRVSSWPVRFGQSSWPFDRGPIPPPADDSSGLTSTGSSHAPVVRATSDRDLGSRLASQRVDRPTGWFARARLGYPSGPATAIPQRRARAASSEARQEAGHHFGRVHPDEKPPVNPAKTSAPKTRADNFSPRAEASACPATIACTTHYIR